MVDLLKFFCPSGQHSTPVGVTYENGIRAQWQVEHDAATQTFWQVKGSHEALNEAQEHGYTDDAILLILDNSSADGIPFALRDDLAQRGSKWVGRHMEPGQVYLRRPYVLKLNPATGVADTISQSPITTYMKLQALTKNWRSALGVVVSEVIELRWYLDAACTQLREIYRYGWDEERGPLGLIEFEDPVGRKNARLNGIWPAPPPAENVPVLRRKLTPRDSIRVTPTVPVIVPTPEPQPPPPGVPATLRTIRPDIQARVRRGPSTATGLIVMLAPGAIVDTVATVPGGDGDGFSWYELKAGGYVRADLFTDYAPPQPTVELFKSPLRAPYTRGWEYRAGHPGEDLAVAPDKPVYAGGVGQVAYLIECPKCTDAKPDVGAYGIPLNSPAVMNDPSWGYGFGPSVVVRFDYAVLPDAARAAMDALPGAPKFLYVINAHLNSISVRAGQCVGPDTVLGKSGGRGNSDGAHLHVECRASIRGDETSLMSRATIDPDTVFKL